MTTVVVTGAGGFVGSAVVRHLVGSRNELWDGSPIERVVALLRPGGSLERLETLTHRDGWSFAQVDLHDRRALAAVLRRVRPRAVVHTALDASVYVGRTADHAPLETLFETLAGDDTRFVHAGSAWVLAPGDRLAESAPVDARSPYARCKAEQDALLGPLGERSGVPWINLRLFNVFGRYEKPERLLPSLVSRLSRGEEIGLSQGDQLRDFNDVDDIGGAFGLALGAPKSACGVVYHIGSGRATSVREFALTAAQMAGDPSLIRFGAGRTPDQDLPALVADPARAIRVLGWRPVLSLEQRIHAAAEWWLERQATSLPLPEKSVR
jgi:polyisoprenyl-phosphate glycosyltransferase